MEIIDEVFKGDVLRESVTVPSIPEVNVSCTDAPAKEVVDMEKIMAENPIETIDPMDLVIADKGSWDMVNKLNKSYRRQIVGLDTKIEEMETELDVLRSDRSDLIGVGEDSTPVLSEEDLAKLKELEAKIETQERAIQHFAEFRNNLAQLAVSREDIDSILLLLPKIFDSMKTPEAYNPNDKFIRYFHKCVNADVDTADLAAMKECIKHSIKINVDRIHTKMSSIFRMGSMDYGKIVSSIPENIAKLSLEKLPEDFRGKYADAIYLGYGLIIHGLLYNGLYPFEDKSDRLRHSGPHIPYNAQLMKFIEALATPSMEDYRVMFILRASQFMQEYEGVGIFDMVDKYVETKDAWLKENDPEGYAKKLRALELYDNNMAELEARVDSVELSPEEQAEVDAAVSHLTVNDLEKTEEPVEDHSESAMIDAVKEFEESKVDTEARAIPEERVDIQE